jgi:hypothetical protein
MTAIEWLEKEIKEIISYIEEDGMYAMKGAEERLFGECNIFYKAKEMEKEQIIRAGNSCALKQHLHNDKINKMSESEIRQFAEEEHLTFGEQYYNQTFNK